MRDAQKNPKRQNFKRIIFTTPFTLISKGLDIS